MVHTPYQQQTIIPYAAMLPMTSLALMLDTEFGNLRLSNADPVADGALVLFKPSAGGDDDVKPPAPKWSSREASSTALVRLNRNKPTLRSDHVARAMVKLTQLQPPQELDLKRCKTHYGVQTTKRGEICFQRKEQRRIGFATTEARELPPVPQLVYFTFKCPTKFPSNWGPVPAYILTPRGPVRVPTKVPTSDFTLECDPTSSNAFKPTLVNFTLRRALPSVPPSVQPSVSPPKPLPAVLPSVQSLKPLPTPLPTASTANVSSVPLSSKEATTDARRRIVVPKLVLGRKYVVKLDHEM